MSVGFRFEPASNGIPSSVFFPQSDPDERLTQCSASLQALLGMPTSNNLSNPHQLYFNLVFKVYRVPRSMLCPS